MIYVAMTNYDADKQEFEYAIMFDGAQIGTGKLTGVKSFKKALKLARKTVWAV